jgi:monoamine oxidase
MGAVDGSALTIESQSAYAISSGTIAVTIIGGGLAGLRAAHKLQKLNGSISCKVFEGSNRLGGRCLTS